MTPSGTATRRCAISVRAIACLSLLLLAAMWPSPANAAGPTDFYQPPVPLPSGEPGDIIRTSRSVAVAPATSTRIMYRSTDSHGDPIAVTGTVLNPLLPWTGTGDRPLVSFAEGTQGQGDQCAPSKTLSSPLAYRPPLDVAAGYEVPFITALLSQGFVVVVTDYQGLGTPGTHTYLNRRAEAHAVIDAARAAQRLPGSQIPSHGPVGFFGYSQGGGASGAAAELVASYAPELDVVGSFVGAPPADLHTLLASGDKSILSGAIGYYVNGLQADNPESAAYIDAALNAAGRTWLSRVSKQCLVQTALSYGFRSTTTFTASKRTIAEILDAGEATRSAMHEDNLGSGTPSAPVLLSTGDNDDIVPAGPIRDLAKTWCANGAAVHLTESPVPTLLPRLGLGHIVNYPVVLQGAIRWLRDRFEGRPDVESCT